MIKKLWLIIALLFLGCGGDSNVKADAGHYKDLMTYIYVTYYKNYTPVTCNTSEYKGYLFVKCFQTGNSNDGGIYVVDDTAKNKDGGFDYYAVNGKARSHREVVFKNAGGEYYDFKELPLPMPKWLDISEVNQLLSDGGGKNYKGEYIKKSLFSDGPIR